MGELEFNTAIAALMELNNRLTQVVQDEGSAPREVVRAMVLMLAPLTPHVAEELWERLGEAGSLPFADVPGARSRAARRRRRRDPGAGQRQGAGPGHGGHGRRPKPSTRPRRGRTPKVAELLAGATVRKVVVVPGRMVNFVLG